MAETISEQALNEGVRRAEQHVAATQRALPCPCGDSCGLDTKGNRLTPSSIRSKIMGLTPAQ